MLRGANQGVVMARKPQITQDALAALGAVKLAQLVLDEAERNAGFKRQVLAAMAGQNGPQAVAKLIDRRLAALEKARGFIDWNKARSFRDDLAATVATIVRQLGEDAPAMAIDRLLRFVATHEAVFERVDDSSGRVQDVYYEAIEAAGALTARLTPDEMAIVPDRIMAALGQSRHGYLADVAQAVIPHLPPQTLRVWDGDLARLQAQGEAQDAKTKDAFLFSNTSQYVKMRQVIADTLGDLDGLIALEMRKHPNLQDTLGVAARLLQADRAAEALEWVRREKPGVKLMYMSRADLADGRFAREAMAPARVSLEAAILDRLGDKDAAQALRWSAFEMSLDIDMLREHIAHLPDFEEFDVLDRAFEHVMASKQIYNALEFLLTWPQLDLAARLVIQHYGAWDGRHYEVLSQAAEALEDSAPVAAVILYRALIDDILNRGMSNAYAHAARYLSALDALALVSDAEAGQVKSMDVHVTYRTGLLKKHGRKYGFWGLVPKD